MRGSLHCGYMPRSEWSREPAAVPPSFGGEPYTLDICPGWVVRQPEVVAGAEAYAALEAGALHIYDPLGLNLVWELAMIAKRSFNFHEARRQREMQDRLGVGR